MTRAFLFAALFAGLTAAACSKAETPPPAVAPPASEQTAITDTSIDTETAALAAMDADRAAELALIAELGLKPYGPNSERTEETLDILLPAPWDTVTDAAGAPISVQDIMGPQGAVIVFSRSADWCPYCQKQMVELEQAKVKLAEEGMTLTVLTYDAPDILAAFAEKHALTYTFVSDTDSSTIKSWGLLNDEIPANTGYHGVPYPGFAMLSPDGDIKGLIINQDYKVRPSVDELVREAVGFRDAG